MQCIEFALIQAVTAGHTARVIHFALFEVYGLGFAVLFTHATLFALVLVKNHSECRDTRNEAEGGTHRTNRVTVKATFAPSYDGQY